MTALPNTLADAIADAWTLVDPPIGETLIWGDTPSFTGTAGDPNEFALSTADGEKAYTGWVRLVLTAEAHIGIDTFGSQVINTLLFVYAGLPSASSWSIYSNDDTSATGFNSPPQVTSGQSSINSDGSTNLLPPGTYYIAALPYDGALWNSSEGRISVRITRLASAGFVSGRGWYRPKLPLRWVHQRIAKELATPFDSGIHGADLSTPFDMLGVPVSAELSTPFDIFGFVGATLSTPFYMLGSMGSTLSTPFDMVAATGQPVWGLPVTGTPIVVTLTSDVSAGDTVLTLSSTSGILVGSSLQIGSEIGTVIEILGPTSVRLGAPLAYPHLSGTVVTSLSVLAYVVLASDANAGDTTITVVSTSGITAGMLISIGGTEIRRVVSVTGTTITLDAPLAYDHLTGSFAASYAQFAPILTVFTKGGTPVGVITDFSITSPPTQAIMSSRSATAAQGQMVFHIPRTLEDGQTPNPQANLIADDRLVAVGLEVGGPLWAGSIEPQNSSGGVIQATCFDLFGQFNNTPEVEFDQSVADGTPAWSVIQLIIDACNLRRGADNELLWSVEHTGSKPFRGPVFQYKGDIIGALEEIVTNSGIELLWRADISGSLSATLVVSDRFESASSFTLFDGPGGNIMARPDISRDPSQLVHEITLTGAPTDLSDCLPEYASWAIRDSTPTVTVSVDPGDNRRRAKLDISVPWGYSQSTIAEICSGTLDEVWELYYSYLRAIHDMEGRPFHEGYLYNNDRQEWFDSTESGAHALSRIAWRTRLQLIETYPDTPASAIMISDQHNTINRNTWLIVTYNRQTGVKFVRQWAVPDTVGASMTRWHMDDNTSTILYTASGTRITARETFTVDPGESEGYNSFCESYNTRLWDPVNKRYLQLRRIIAGVRLGKFFNPNDPDITLTDLGPGAGIDPEERSQLIGKIYDFESYNIINWDPYRDGVGEWKSAPTIFNGHETTRYRWHILSYNAGSEASTTLVYGISATEQQVLVDSFLGWPTPESDDFPFKASFGEGLAREVVLVDGMDGTDWHVQRGQDGTTAIIHESGEAVHRVGGSEEQGISPIDLPWPEGEAYARELLDDLSRAKMTISLQIANLDDAWREADFGKILPIAISTEGAGTGFTGSARVIGRSPDPFGVAGPPGSLELVVEVIP